MTASRPGTMLRHLGPPAQSTVACYPLESLARAMDSAGLERIDNSQGPAQVFATKSISRLRLARNLARLGNGPVFVAFMGFSESRTLPFSLWTELVPYCFDCWPSAYPRWHSFFRRHRTRLAFFSARQSAEHFTRTRKEMRSVWLPEATDPGEYDSARPLAQRGIDVLELGRKNDEFHSAITPSLLRERRKHLFERVKGQIIFPDRHSLIAGLGNTKVSICFPCSQTHPERSGEVETVTHRYFESMASKCVLLGHCPDELQELFGYSPVVKIEKGHEAEQLKFVLTNVREFQPMVERNYARLLEIGTWASRLPTVFHHTQEILRVAVPSHISEVRNVA